MMWAKGQLLWQVNEWTMALVTNHINDTKPHTTRPRHWFAVHIVAVAWFVRKSLVLLFWSIVCDWDRICRIGVYRDQRKVLCVFFVYLIYVDNKENSTEQYLETISNLQVLVDSYCKGPWMIVGDCNSRHPQANVLHKKGYNTQPFSKWSLILYVKARCS